MITDRELVKACRVSYSGAAPNWGREDTAHAFLIESEGKAIIALEGTTTGDDVAIDFEAVPVDERGFDHQDIGIVHLGFYTNVAAIIDDIIAYLKTLPAETEIGLTGHSLGAGEAQIACALVTLAGIKVTRCSTFGTPHAGSMNGLVTSKIGADYKNGNDPVADVPFYLPHARPITKVISPSPMFDKSPSWGSMIWHHLENYERVEAFADGS